MVLADSVYAREIGPDSLSFSAKDIIFPGQIIRSLEVMRLLEIEDLSVSIGSKQVLKNFDLRINRGETHALFGPNGTGKTTLLNVIAGIPRYTIDGGRIVFKGKDITHMSMDERARLGIGMAFQRPPAIRGLRLKDLIKIINPKADAPAILKKMDFEAFGDRDVNRGFSGGEVKRSEMVQLLAQQPDLVMLDEPDSGVDLENIKLIGEAINLLTQKDQRPSLPDQVGDHNNPLRPYPGVHEGRPGSCHAGWSHRLQRKPD